MAATPRSLHISQANVLKRLSIRYSSQTSRKVVAVAVWRQADAP